jgi:DNA-binding transcriptional LysR family regulator
LSGLCVKIIAHESNRYGIRLNNYKLLPALISLLQTRNITESAKALHVTQSAMSKTLGQIRQAFNDPILVRETNHFVLTQRGEALKQQLPGLLQQLDGLYLPRTFDPKKCTRKFTFASTDYVAQAIFPSICSAMSLQAPDASTEYQSWDKQWLDELSGRSLDLVSSITDVIPEKLYGELMAQDQQAIVLRKTHPLCTQKLTIDDYTQAKHILISSGGDKDSPVEQALAVIGKQRQVFANVPFFQAAIELLLTTDTLLTTPLHIAGDFAQRYDLHIKPLPLTLKPHNYYLLWHAKHHQDPQHKWFRELCYPRLKQHLTATIAQGMKLLHTSE